MSGMKKAFDAAVEKRTAAVPWESAEAIRRLVYDEAGIWHCQLHWPMRGEPVQAALGLGQKRPDGRSARLENVPVDGKVILWVLAGKKERVSEAVEMAAWRYFAYFDRWPDTAWVGKRLAKYVGREVVVDEVCRVRLALGEWLPEMGIGAGVQSRKKPALDRAV
jgi:hypothetical protein